MEISDTTIGVFYLCKVIGLAPFAVRRNSKGVLEIRRSLIFTIYTVALITILVFLTYKGLIHDANSKITVRSSFKMKTATSKVVTALDVSIVVLSTTAGVFCGLTGLKATRELNLRLRKIDNSLHSFINFKKDRLRAILIAILPLFAIIILLAHDLLTWIRFTNRLKTANEEAELNVQWYIAFYCLYMILISLHIVFANTALGLGRRFIRLNLMLKSTFLTETKNDSETSKQKITTVKSILSSSPLTLHGSLLKLTDDNINDGSIKNKSILIKLMAENHESLSKCMTLVSSSYGIAVLFILVSCLLHLVATAYFLFLEMLSRKDNGYLLLQVFWIAFHIIRLLMVVEPCNLATFESKKTMQIVCEIERKVHDPILIEEIKKFWQQLLVLNAEFSACGLCSVNRRILTAFSSAICTYLVILIQFQGTNG